MWRQPWHGPWIPLLIWATGRSIQGMEPKIDIKVMDAMDWRVHICATVQLDFQLPLCFELQYNMGEKHNKQAISLRGPSWCTGPCWEVWNAYLPSGVSIMVESVSPPQSMVMPTHAEFNDYAPIHSISVARPPLLCQCGRVQECLLIQNT